MLSLALVACNTTKPSDVQKLDEKDIVSTSCLPLGSKDKLLSVEIQGIENCNIQVNSTFDVSWKTDNSIPLQDKQYNFIVFTMPHTVRFNGSGFLMLPPEVKLPFGFKFAPDEMRVLFPLYLLDDKTQGSFQVRTLVAGDFTLKWTYVVVKENGEIVFSSSDNKANKQLTTFEVQDKNPIIVVQDKVGIKKPEKVWLSPSLEYELRVFKDRFQVLYAKTGELILERAGKSPIFSPGSRFIGYFPTTEKSYSPSIEILDLLDKKTIYDFSEFEFVAWGKNDLFLMIGHPVFGVIWFTLPFSDIVIHIGGYEPSVHSAYHAEIALDLENALLHDYYFYSYNSTSLIGKKSKVCCPGKSCEHECSWTDYTNLLQSLRLVPNPKIFSIPEAWKIEEGFKVTHLGYEKAGITNFLVSSPVTHVKNPLSIKIASIKNRKISFRGNSINKRTVLRLNTHNNNNKTSKLLERLNDFGMAIQKKIVPLEKSDWVKMNPKQFENSQEGYTFYSYVTDLIKKIIQSFIN